jgi:hypothetical protein
MELRRVKCLINSQSPRCTLRERSNLETLAGLLTLDLPLLPKCNQ